MNTVLMVAAIFGLALGIFSIIVGPFMIGEERKPFSAFSYLVVLLESILFILLSGHVFGWW